MDDGNKIRINKPEVKLFLHGDLLPANPEAPVKYNLKEEYAKTRKNKSPFIFVVLISCMLIVTALTIGLVLFLQERNNSLEVDIKVFDDLNLKNLLDVVTRTQNSLDLASNEKNQLELELSTKINQAALARDAEIQLLESLRMDNAAKRREENSIEQRYNETVEALNAEYEPRIALLEAQMEDYTEQLASYDSSNVELAQKQETALNSQRQVFELEKQEIIADYETLVAELVSELDALQKLQLQTQRNTLSALESQHTAELNVFDPIFSDERGNALVGKYDVVDEEGVTIEQPVFSASDYALQLSTESLQQNIENVLIDVNSDFSDFNYIAGIVTDVPWTNSLKDYVQTLAMLANKIGDDIISSSITILSTQDNAIKEAQSEIAAKTAEIIAQNQQLASITEENNSIEFQLAATQLQLTDLQSRFTQMQEKMYAYENIVYSVDARARQSGDAGYILNTSDKENISVYISPVFADSVADGSRAFVFRSSGTLVGMVSLYRRGSVIYATPDEGVADNLRPNDVILLELVQ